MNELERLDELRVRVEDALKRSVSQQQPGSQKKKVNPFYKPYASQIELLLENETLRSKKTQLEAELQTYKFLFENAPIANLTIDKNGDILKFNNAARDIFEAANGDMKNPSVFVITEHHSLNDLRELLEKALRTGQDQSGHIQLAGTDNEKDRCRILLAPYIEEESGESLCQMIIYRYPDQENYYKQELKKKEKEFHALMSNISDGIFYTENGILNSVNPSLSHIFGYAEKDLEGRALWDLVTDSQQKHVRDLFLKSSHTDLEPAYDIKCVRSDGTVFWAELKVNHLSPGNKSIGTISDISRRKLSENRLKDSERQLRRSNVAKDKLFSIISHDLKTPFNTLMGYTYLLMKEYNKYDEKKRESMVRSLYDVTKQTFNMLENILVWSRSQTGGIPFAPRAFNISNLLQENVRLYTPTARSKNITIALDDKTRDVQVFADPEMVQTVIRNLVTNAIKFTPEKGRITLGLIDDEEDEKISVAVKDNGVGIDPGKIGSLFQIESNYSTRGTNDEKGTGLGLTVCKEFIEKNGGKIWVESKPGKGSCFYFSLYKKIHEVS
jgi:PAS domain S-box-containing protein